MAADEPLPFTEDDPQARITSGPVRPLPETSFAGISDAAIDHAADVPRRDAQSATLVWAPIGPRNIGGRIRCFVQDPQDPRILYAGSGQGGIWKSENGGDTWRSLGTLLREGKEVAAPVGAIALCHRATQHLYVGTGEHVPGFFAGHGLFYSDDGGARFTRIAPPSSGAAGAPILADRFERILVDPWQPKRAWIAAPTGLWRSGPGANAAAAPIFGATADVIDDPAAGAAPQDVTDVMIDFGDRTQAAPPATFTVYAAVRGGGLFRATFDTATGIYRLNAGVAWARLGAAAAGAGFVALPVPAVTNVSGRIKLALCEAQPQHLYYIAALAGGAPSRVFHSDNGGARWRQRASGPEQGSVIGWYALTLAVHPTNPAILAAGSVHLARSVNSGANWTRIIDSANYDRGDRSQHADQHDATFDLADVRQLLANTGVGTPQRQAAERTTRLWSANDGGIALASDQAGATRWRKRSHGILGAQFYDVTVHPTFPFISGGGLQDNGTWVGYGGPSWYYLDTADGGAMGFEPGDPRRFLTTTQGVGGTQFGLRRSRIDSPAAGTVGGPNAMVNPIPDVETPGMGTMRSTTTEIFNNFVAADSGVFGGRLEAVTGVANTWIVARQNRPYRSVNGTVFNPLGTPAFGAAGEVSAIAVAASDAANTWWIGSSVGDIFRSTNGGTAWTPQHAAPIPAGTRIADIAVHPQNTNIVAVVVDNPVTTAFLSRDAGANWFDISNRAVAADSLPPSAATCIRFDPTAGAALTDPQTLYVGTPAGVYVARGVVPGAAAGPAPQAQWRTLNAGMPLVLVQDLAFSEFRDGGGNVTQRLLRAASFGRGMFEVDLAGTPAVRLLIRTSVVDDGRVHAGAADLTFDPRLRGPAAAPQVTLDHQRGFDIRVDAPVSFDVGQVMDGAEFDEQLRNGVLRRGDVNHVYVQVQNTGFDRVDDVRVGLYFARPDGAGDAPDLDADFWTTYPAPPAPDRVWQRAGEVTLSQVGPEQPQVARFVWNAPLDLPRNVALLALASHARDALGAPAPTLQVDPRAHGAASLVRAERRAAMRLVRSQGALFTRDAVDDTGEVGAIAWGARSHDIVVRQAAEANPDTAFASLTDRRLGDTLRAGTRNHIFVRVHNRQAAQQQIRVRLLRAVFPNFQQAGGWTEIGTATVTVPANASRFTRPGLIFDAPADVAPGQAYKGMLLLALAGTDNDPQAQLTDITDLAAFWRVLVTSPESNNVGCRAMRVSAPP
ncbi:WD40/YVTN/BNR-like repeat-containing protein [Neoroseomonas lacus]|uniref:Glycosyl hydrolase n=1 Tax=Neoroseomonas lacus TaxID=287609 RepID=A0A917NJG2_9PROT|nr:hypothetical protein [Neoroseomonas lacus]GGJ02299.1 hypothetical protein GCM10011320_06390 [Neoroseomonas lacus]